MNAISGNPFVTTNPDVTGKKGMTKASDVSGTTGINDIDQPGIDIEALRKEAQEIQGKARAAKAKRNLEWLSMHAKLKDMWRRIDEEKEMIRKTRHKKERYQASWEGIWSSPARRERQVHQVDKGSPAGLHEREHRQRPSG